MSIRATCDQCGRDFLLSQLYAVGPDMADRCPNCGRHLGLPNLSVWARHADEALAVLSDRLRGLAGHPIRFHLREDTITEPVNEALRQMRALGPAPSWPSGL
jgi:hypothetical protein